MATAQCPECDSEVDVVDDGPTKAHIVRHDPPWSVSECTGSFQQIEVVP